MMVLLMLAGAAWGGPCVPPDVNGRRAALTARAPALGTVVLEIPLFGDMTAPESILAALDEHSLPATLLVTHAWASQHIEFLADAANRGHEVGLWVSLAEDLHLQARAADPAVRDWISVMKRGRKTIRKATGVPVQSIGMAMLPASAEIAAEALGFKAILPIERTLHDRPRRARSASTGDGRASNGRARIIGQGPYTDGCGHMLPHWSPAALDRATSVAARGPWVRIGLPSDPLAGALVERWADDVIRPHGWRVVRAETMANIARKTGDEASTKAPSIPVPKVIGIEEWKRAAVVIATSGNLPRHPTQNLNLTEAFYGLVVLNAAEVQPTSVTLGRLDPPHEIAPARKDSSYSLSAADVRAAAQAVQPRLRGRTPALITIGGRTLTAAQALQAFARVFLGEPAHVSAVVDPDPYAPGGGWGQSIGQ